MRLYFLGSRAEFEQAIREDWYTEWSIGFGSGILLRADRPPCAGEVVVLDIPRALVEPYARGRPWPGEYIVPREFAAGYEATPDVSGRAESTRRPRPRPGASDR